MHSRTAAMYGQTVQMRCLGQIKQRRVAPVAKNVREPALVKPTCLEAP